MPGRCKAATLPPWVRFPLRKRGVMFLVLLCARRVCFCRVWGFQGSFQRTWSAPLWVAGTQALTPPLIRARWLRCPALGLHWSEQVQRKSWRNSMTRAAGVSKGVRGDTTRPGCPSRSLPHGRPRLNPIPSLASIAPGAPSPHPQTAGSEAAQGKGTVLGKIQHPSWGHGYWPESEGAEATRKLLETVGAGARPAETGPP